MYIFLMLWLFLFFMGGVASNPSPYFGSVALMVSSVLGAGILAGLNTTFVSLVLVLIYLGGMLVVFVYSVAMSCDVYPEVWGNRSVSFYVMSFMIYLFFLCWYVGGGWFFDNIMFINSVLLDSVVVDLGGIVLLYSVGGGGLLILVAGLLLTLFVVLDLVCGWCFGSVRI